jgi:hypothetical protein
MSGLLQMTRLIPVVAISGMSSEESCGAAKKFFVI